jgi:hypothetical protein
MHIYSDLVVIPYGIRAHISKPKKARKTPRQALRGSMIHSGRLFLLVLLVVVQHSNGRQSMEADATVFVSQKLAKGKHSSSQSTKVSKAATVVAAAKSSDSDGSDGDITSRIFSYSSLGNMHSAQLEALEKRVKNMAQLQVISAFICTIAPSFWCCNLRWD